LNDWSVGVNPTIEKQLSRDLLKIFDEFWENQHLNEKSKTTKNRYSNALHALGGYLIDQAIHSGNMKLTAHERLFEHIDPDEGPLIYHDNEDWQKEVDMVCRKLYKYIKMTR
jgi:hypothetical protein